MSHECPHILFASPGSPILGHVTWLRHPAAHPTPAPETERSLQPEHRHIQGVAHHRKEGAGDL